jgi:RNA polymerase sigma-70 factor (family 1)
MASHTPTFAGIPDREPHNRPLPDLPDSLLMQSALSGDERAFAALVHRFSAPLFHYIFHILQDADEAEDILQQVFLKLYLSLPTLHHKKPLKGWLFRITRNQCLDYLRRKAVLRFSELEASEHESESSPLAMLADPGPLPEEVAEHHDQQRAIDRVIYTLPPKVRTIILLRYAEQLSYPEIAERVGMPITTVKTYVHRAKPFLRAALLSQKKGEEIQYPLVRLSQQNFPPGS